MLKMNQGTRYVKKFFFPNFLKIPKNLSPTYTIFMIQLSIDIFIYYQLSIDNRY